MKTFCEALVVAVAYLLASQGTWAQTSSTNSQKTAVIAESQHQPVTNSDGNKDTDLFGYQACWSDKAFPHSDRASFSFTEMDVRAIDNIVKVGQRFYVTFKVTNLSDHPVCISQGFVKDLFMIDVRDNAGNQPLEGFARVMLRTGKYENMITREKLQWLEPHKSAMLQEYSWQYALNEPGEYTVQAHRLDPTSGIDVRSNTETITVVP
jgi:hypothetical protein